MKTQFPGLVFGVPALILLLVVAGCAVPVTAQEIESRDISVKYSPDGATAQIQVYNSLLFGTITVTFVDAQDKTVATLTAAGEKWTPWTEAISLPCEIEVRTQSGRRRTATVEPTAGTRPAEAGALVSGAKATVVSLLADKPAPYDRILLTDGEVLSGTVTTATLNIKTADTILPFAPDKLAVIEMAGAGGGADTIVPRTGDKVAGVLETAAISVKLVGGGDTTVEKDKIRAIRFREGALR